MPPATKRSSRSSKNQVAEEVDQLQEHQPGLEQQLQAQAQEQGQPGNLGQENHLQQAHQHNHHLDQNNQGHAGQELGDHAESQSHHQEEHEQQASHPGGNGNGNYGATLGTLEPSAQSYNPHPIGDGRRGSTDPMLHASLAATASAAVASAAERRGSITSGFSYDDGGHFYAQYPPNPYNGQNGQGSSALPTASVPEGEGEQEMNQQHEDPPYMPQDPLLPPGTGTNNRLNGGRKETPYSRSPDMRVTHATAERKRRKEMKDLFDELRGLLPGDKGPKTSKWEILQKAVDTIKSFADEHGSLVAEAELLRRELAAYRGEQGTAQEHEEVDAAQAEAAYQAHQDASMYATQQPEAEAGAEAEEPYNQ